MLHEVQMMAKEQRFISENAVKKMALYVGAERISDKGKEKMRQVAEDYTTSVLKEALAWAKHAKRITIEEEDIDAATKK
ncbi:MAG: histone [Candidatus Pacearchaeota archaeon]|jgi:histone H3/H4